MIYRNIDLLNGMYLFKMESRYLSKFNKSKKYSMHLIFKKIMICINPELYIYCYQFSEQSF